LEKENEGQEASDDGGDQVMNSWKDRCFLLDAVMNWRVEDVMNVDLFKKRVGFDVPSPYLSYLYLLVLAQDTDINNLLLAY
jgi:hypothetical protein